MMTLRGLGTAIMGWGSTKPGELFTGSERVRLAVCGVLSALGGS